ncbi:MULTISPECIES: efflux RND transporter periplasmic adaptor subunit [unclassified Streptomyces]|uniref:efflux RND transporter periplasmic adaptor subunit n=1 Tax=unclassified Streptomyces TaxID=2593676 RepID=UPI00226FF36F|nr:MULTISPECIES: peptidoglycan-binding protein [unclassified Streptomyces]MCY0924086.1 peptidoglycan-binding protein [Streptomyces sp. H27-G5]MCY0963137.1 peptidoglycan-binding protein [Streptomyces sp. H27-H5]
MTAATESSTVPQGEDGGDDLHVAAPRHRPRGRKSRGRWIIAAVLVAAVGGSVYYATVDTGPAPVAGADEPKQNTDKVTRGTLVNSKQVDGTLGFKGSTSVNGRLAGTVTGLPGVGSTVSRGEQLYGVDGKPVILLYGSSPAYRDMKSGDKGEDVRQLEENLQALGYSGFTVDEEFTDLTAQAVKRWQKALGVAQTGNVEDGRVVFVSGALRIGERKAPVGSAVQPGAPVLTGTSSKRQVHVDLDIADRALVKEGGSATVTLPDGKTVKGTITGVGTTVKKTPGVNGGADKSTIGVDIDLDGDVGDITEAPVTVGLQSEKKENVLTVPITALLALSEGGYGVEVIGADGKSTVVAVKLGMFANGRVEVSGSGLAAGATVGAAA